MIFIMEAANENHRKCPQCGKIVIGRVDRVYCSKSCKKLAFGRRRYQRGMAKECTCQNCGKIFHPKASNRVSFCSRECDQAKRKSEAAMRPPKPKKQKPPKAMHHLKCVQCGSEFESVNPGKAHCSETCAARTRNIANDNIDRAPRSCAECGKEFSPAYGSKRRKFCCTGCASKQGQRIAKARREAAKRGVEAETFDPIEVLDRDGWRCMNCGVETPRELRGTWVKNAPELDHIIPLARGGPHTRANTQCLCRQCNGEKSDRLDFAA